MNITKDFLEKNNIPTENLVFSNHLPYDPRLVPLSRDLRTNGTKAEAMLWNILKNKQCEYRFSRQKPILGFIVDFYCHSLRLVVEIDGGYHNSEEQYISDVERDRQLNAIGLTVVRVSNDEIEKNPITGAQIVFSRAGLEFPESLRKLCSGRDLSTIGRIRTSWDS